MRRCQRQYGEVILAAANPPGPFYFQDANHAKIDAIDFDVFAQRIDVGLLARLVGPEFHSPALNVAMLPIHVDLKHLPPGGRETFADPSQQILEDSTERRIYRRSEVIIQKDTVGEEAFLIMRGSVRAIVENAAGADWLDGPMFGPGQIIGELSLLDGGPRTVTLVAYSNEVDVMVWTREELLQQLRASQDKALQVLEEELS